MKVMPGEYLIKECKPKNFTKSCRTLICVASSSPKTKNRKRKTAVVLASGGLDSCVAAAVARRDFDLALFHANYAQRTLMRELEAFRAQAAFYQVASTLEVDLNYLGEIGGSSLTDFDRAVPTDEVEPPGIPSTYVPFRNTNLLAAAVAWAEVLGAEAVFIGANVLDNPGYPDCRPEYFEAFNRLIELGTRPETHLPIHTPLIHLDKGGIVRLGLELGAPFELTWSCYQDEIRPAAGAPPAACASGLRGRGRPRPHPLSALRGGAAGGWTAIGKRPIRVRSVPVPLFNLFPGTGPCRQFGSIIEIRSGKHGASGIAYRSSGG